MLKLNLCVPFLLFSLSRRFILQYSWPIYYEKLILPSRFVVYLRRYESRRLSRSCVRLYRVYIIVKLVPSLGQNRKVPGGQATQGVILLCLYIMWGNLGALPSPCYGFSPTVSLAQLFTPHGLLSSSTLPIFSALPPRKYLSQEQSQQLTTPHTISYAAPRTTNSAMVSLIPKQKSFASFRL